MIVNPLRLEPEKQFATREHSKKTKGAAILRAVDPDLA